MSWNDTIFALSSGAPPAALAVMRISGPAAGAALGALAGAIPAPRVASLRSLRAADGSLLDRGLVLWFRGPATATGEDLAELHLHGGRAVVRAVEMALGELPGLRPATPGEFTRRAFANGRIDLSEAEGLADLLCAETELQRRQALSLATGRFSAQVGKWREQILAASAAIEALLDFGDEDDVEPLTDGFRAGLKSLTEDLRRALDTPSAEMLREGFLVVLAGPPNSGKSSLFNRLVEQDAAITAPVAGTTRDILTRPVSLEGIPFVFADTAGLRDASDDTIELIGIARARGELERADLVLWLGQEGQGKGRLLWELESFADLGSPMKNDARHRVSASTGEGLENLRRDLVELAREAMPGPTATALNRRQRELLDAARSATEDASDARDPLIVAECLRLARQQIDRLTGHSATEDMLDALFSRFCIGK
jgi:tRNA modification GTPase